VASDILGVLVPAALRAKSIPRRGRGTFLFLQGARALVCALVAPPHLAPPHFLPWNNNTARPTMPSRYPAREAEDRFHSRYGSGGEYVVANYTTGQANIGHENEAAEQVPAAVARRASLTSEASAGPRPQTAPAREKSSSGWRNLNKCVRR